MNKRGFSGGEQSEIAKNQSIEETSNGAGQIAHGSTEAIKGGIKTIGEGLETTGDAVSYAGIATAQPEVVAVGETISTTGTAMNTMVDISDGKPIENVAVETAVSIGFGKLGKEGIKATRKVAGEDFVKSGANKVSESIIEGTLKVYESLFNDNVTPLLLPKAEKLPVYGPVD